MTAQLVALFTNGEMATYANPSNNVCVSIKECLFWEQALLISWWDIEETETASFFESDNCNSENGYLFHSTDTTGTQSLAPGKPIRSMMLVLTSNSTPSDVTRKCQIHKLISRSIESATIDGNGTASNATLDASDAGISPNWFDALADSDTSKASDSTSVSFDDTSDSFA